VVAQEVEEIFPELVRTDADGYKSVDYAKLTPILLEAVKELNRTNEMLLARLARLESAVAALGPTARNTVGAPPAGNGHDAGEVR